MQAAGGIQVGKAPVTVARRVGLGVPVRRSAAVPVGRADIPVGQTDVPLARAAAAADNSWSTPVPGADGRPVHFSARAVARQVAPSPEQEPETAAAPAPATATATAATATAAATTQGAVHPGGGAVPDAELPALAEKIYEHLARRLRAELLADRERRGLLADPL
jgi:hypothetical protein